MFTIKMSISKLLNKSQSRSDWSIFSTEIINYSTAEYTLEAVMDYFPYGKILREYIKTTERYVTTGHERDEETGLDYRGARFYDSDVARFLSLDPAAVEYPSLSDYCYVGGNPIKYIDPDGRTFVDADGKKIKARVRRNGTIKLGRNATKDLIRMASMIEATGSKTALNQFKRLDKHVTKIHFKIDETSTTFPNGTSLPMGMHRPYDESGNELEWNFEEGKFDGSIATTKTKDGKLAYKEASITLYEAMFTDGSIQWALENTIGVKDSNIEPEEAMVGTFSHEAEHDLDEQTPHTLIKRQMGYYDGYDVEAPAYKKQKQVHLEIKENRKENKK
jgi:RHS repeat-associated protein